MCKYKRLINNWMVNLIFVCYLKYFLKVGILICIKNIFDILIFII